MGKSRIDLTNKDIGVWHVISINEYNGNSDYQKWNCICDKGHMSILTTKQINRLIQCSECRRIKIENKRIEKEKIRNEYWKNKYSRLIGEKFGSLSVVKFDGYNHKNQIMWECICECNSVIRVSSTDLTKGYKDNCGCRTKYKMALSKKKTNKYDLNGECGIGYTNKGEEFYFDLEDYNLIKDYCWVQHDGYIDARWNKTTVKQHRLIMDLKPGDGLYVDHINHNTNDNRKFNLRICSNQENTMNHKLHKNNTTGKSGVNFRKDTNKWRVRIYKNYKCHTIGHFDNYEDAVRARINAEKELFGEFANKKEWSVLNEL